MPHMHLTDGTAILKKRGWLPLGASRRELPDVSVTAEPVTVRGWLAQPANPGLRLGDAAGGDLKWPRVIPHVDYLRLAILLGYPLRPAVILLEPGTSAGYGRDWQPRFGGYGPERHQGYAVQWFAAAGSGTAGSATSPSSGKASARMYYLGGSSLKGSSGLPWRRRF